MELKQCLKCKENKELKHYAKDNSKSDKLSQYCRPCKKIIKNNTTSRPEKIIKNIPEISKWLGENYNQLIINCKKVCGKGYHLWGEDLLPFIIQEFLEKGVDYQLKVLADGKIEHWITNAMSFQLKSSTSPFYYKQRRQLINERSEGIEDFPESEVYNEEILDNLHSVINGMSEEHKHLATWLYIEGKEQKEYYETFGVTQYSMKQNIISIQKIIKQKLQHHFN